MNPIGAVKRFVRMVFRKTTPSLYGLFRSSLPWYRSVTEVKDSSTVAATVMWCARNFPEAPPCLSKLDAEGQAERVIDHPMLRLLRRPNEYHSGTLLWMATMTDWKMDGNSYWLKIRNGFGSVVELWWVPSWMMCPEGDENTYIKHYAYTPENETLIIPPEDVVHFRFGLDPYSPLKGMSPLKSVLREVFTDDEAAVFTASILSNMGVPGVVISPDKDADVTSEDLDATRDYFDAKFSGTGRGGTAVMSAATRVDQFGFSPEQLMLTEIRRVPEERVTACLGVPAIVVGLGAGLDRSTFTNMGEASEYAYSNGLIPDQRLMADVVTWQLLTEYTSDPFMWEFGFDLSNVRALQGDRDRLSTRLNAQLSAGAIMVSEHRREFGRPVDPARDDVFLRQGNLVQVNGEQMTPLAPASSNGNGTAAHRRELVMGGVDG